MTCLVLASEGVDSGFPVEAHQLKHSTTCCVATPTLLENKMPLLEPSSAFPNTSIVPLVKCLSLANLHHVFPITGKYAITTSPPPSVPRAGILAPRCRVKRSQSSPVPCEHVQAIGSCLLYAGWVMRYPSLICEQQGTSTVPFGPSVSAVSLVQVYDASNAGFSRQHRPQG
jgi:hypothetical protein